MIDPTIAVAVIGSVTTLYIARQQSKMNKKVDETHQQTTQNGHRHDPPTIPDRLSSLATEVQGLHDRMDGHEELHKRLN